MMDVGCVEVLGGRGDEVVGASSKEKERKE